ncbi:MAG: hypothetical protein M3M88_07940 [Thermoproteota archaeon]|nr:hypothetical protein [Thermoproteota archaeon]
MFCCNRKGQPKKGERKILRTLETVTRPDELAKEFLAKSTPTNPNKEQIVLFFRFAKRLVLRPTTVLSNGRFNRTIFLLIKAIKNIIIFKKECKQYPQNN